MEQLNLLTGDEQRRRIASVADALRQHNIQAALICDNANLYYLTGRVFSGYIAVTADGDALWFVRRPNHLEGDAIHYIRKPEQISELCAAEGINPAGMTVGFELSTLNVSDFRRLVKALGPAATTDITPVMRQARSVKSPVETKLLRISGVKQEECYRRVPSLYRPGMTDIQFQIEIERALRLNGCLGQFRISGSSMELFMANILSGDNADNPTPYDFAMGGAGIDPSLPIGANGSVITPGHTVMVDANGNFTGYMTDMTRTFRLGDISAVAELAHRCSIDICEAVSSAARPGVKASELYELAASMARDASLEDYFMGHHQKAGFVGHGVGIEINEAPVLAPRSKDIIAEGNVFALEPKFVIPGSGAVGIENTYVVLRDRTECLTNAPVDILPL